MRSGSCSESQAKRIVLALVLSGILVSLATWVVIVVFRVGGTSSLENGGGGKSGQKLIDSSCKKALYPALCVSTLLSYPGVEGANPSNFAHISVNVSMDVIQEAYSRAVKVDPKKTKRESSTERTGLEDCMELLEDSMDHLNRSLAEIGNMGVKPLKTQIANVQTWLSAALTNQETCIDGLKESTLTGKADGEWEERCQNLSKLISNALAMIKISYPGNGLETNEFRMPHRQFPRWMSGADRRLLQAPNAAALKVNATVAQDGSGQYTTIAEAVTNAPSHSTQRYVIYIKAGVYEENVDLPKQKTNVMLAGDGRGHTIVASRRSIMDGSTTFNTATFAASGEGFIARDMTFANIAGPEKHQAVALRVGGDMSAIYRCNLIGFQDTLYVYAQRQFYKECNIYGTVDFIFGNAAAVFQECNIVPRTPMVHQKNTITAQGRNDPNQNTGISIQNCRIVASRDLAPVKRSFPTYLGRPWKMYSRTVFIRSFLGDVIHPAGWLEWSGDYALKSLYYGEYKNTGPGAKVDGRVEWDGYRVITTAEEAKIFTLNNFISGSDWLPSTGIPFQEKGLKS